MSDVTTTKRWRGVLVVTLSAGALGLVANRADLLVLATVGVVYAAYPRVTAAPSPTVDIDRRVSDRAPRAGQDVDVTVTVRNDGERLLPDVRVVDGVPSALTVTDGSPRHGTALRPGEATTFTYTLAAATGRHRFEPATVVVRDAAGATERTTSVTAETEIDCSVDATDAPSRSQTIDAVGRIQANLGGSGIEFHSTREYQRSDAMRRVDWKRYAKTGELSTVEFREDRAATVVVLVDARCVAYRGVENEPHAVSYAVTAAEQLFVASLGARNRVGIAALGREVGWFAPGAGRTHRTRGQEFLATHPAFGSHPPDDEPPLDEQVASLRERLPSDAQLLVLSPLFDDSIVESLRSFEARGHAVTVVSPDVTQADTTGRRLAAVERSNRIRGLRRSDIPVVEWNPEMPLAAAASARGEGWA